METTIRLDTNIKKKLDSMRIYPKESYNDVLARIIGNTKKKIDEESLIETIDILSDPETMRDLAEALEEINKGNYGTPLEEIEKSLK